MTISRQQRILQGLSFGKAGGGSIASNGRVVRSGDLLDPPAEPSGRTTESHAIAPQRLGREPAPLVSRKNGRRRIAFGWYGGKYSHLDWLLPLLPRTNQYCEPFAGSAAVLLNRVPSEVETYNDLDGEVVNFFQILRKHSNEFIHALRNTPFLRWIPRIDAR
ncbi:MAG: DNA adenine methylase [Rhodospirillales bacterium]